MRTNTINIAEILSKQPIGTKLYSSLCGEVAFDHITEEGDHIICRSRNIPGSGYVGFTSDGRFYDGKGRVASDGECVLFPSKELRQWDVTQFEDGDVVVVETNDVRFSDPRPYIMIFKKLNWHYGSILYHACTKLGLSDWFETNKADDVTSNPYVRSFVCRAASESEVAELNQTLRKHHLQWNAEKKILEPVPEEDEKPAVYFQFEPFDKVLVRDDDDEKWGPAFFAVFDSRGVDPFGVMGKEWPVFYSQCIPYNDDTKHLLGTSEPYKPKA
nr:MAG TPA: hypothetical protein [Caudoviricetes sp.]